MGPLPGRCRAEGCWFVGLFKVDRGVEGVSGFWIRVIWSLGVLAPAGTELCRLKALGFPVVLSYGRLIGVQSSEQLDEPIKTLVP